MRITTRKAVLAIALAAVTVVMTAGTASASSGTTTQTGHRKAPITDSLTSAARSTKVTLTNNSECTLILDWSWLGHGIWSIYPPAQIPPFSTRSWGSESNELFTGTEGKVSYTTDPSCIGGTNLTIYWNNPYVGPNSYTTTLSNSMDWTLKKVSGGSGNNASVTYNLCCPL